MSKAIGQAKAGEQLARPSLAASLFDSGIDGWNFDILGGVQVGKQK